MAETDTRDRMAQMEEAFAQVAPDAQLPAAVQQVIMDERPQGAIKVAKERDLSKVMRDLKTVATAAGDDFFYRWPVKVKDKATGKYVTDYVEGPSVKLANAVARIYGNCQVRLRAFDQGPHWIIYAQFYDMETGFVYERPFQQRKNQNIGGNMDKDRALDMVFQIGCSKAARNAVTNALSEFTDYAFDVAKEQLVEKIGKNLPRWKERIVERLAELKVDIRRVETVRGKTIKDWIATDVAKVTAELQAIADGMATEEELWPSLEAGAPRPKPEDSPETPAGKVADGDGAGAPKTAGQPDKPAAGGQAQPETKVAGKDEGKPEPTVTKQPDPPAPAEDEPDAEEIARDRFEQAEGMLLKAKDGLKEIDGNDEKAMGEYDTAIKLNINEFEIDAEDKAVLHGRWNTILLEHKRAAGKAKRTKK